MVSTLFLTILAMITIQEAPAAPEPQPPAVDKKLCKRVVPTGSLMPVRICLTREEWKQVNDPNKEAVDRRRMPGIGCARDPNSGC